MVAKCKKAPVVVIGAFVHLAVADSRDILVPRRDTKKVTKMPKKCFTLKQNRPNA